MSAGQLAWVRREENQESERDDQQRIRPVSNIMWGKAAFFLLMSGCEINVPLGDNTLLVFIS